MSFELIRPSSEYKLTVYPEAMGMRLDTFIARKMPWRSRTKIQRLLEKGKITLNGQCVKPSYKVKTGDEIVIQLPPPPKEVELIKDIPLNIIYEDDYMVVLNKQPNIIVHPSGSKRFNTLINALHYRYRNPDDPTKDIVPKLAHRLDKETSGVLVVAKDDVTRRKLYFQFERGRVQKNYMAIVEGKMRENKGTIDLPIGSDESSEIQMKMGIRHDIGVTSQTEFEVIEKYDAFTLLRASPKTGRQHQIRVHFEAIGYPIVCDKLYGVREKLFLSDLKDNLVGEEADEAISDQRKADICLLDRQALHAFRLKLYHPFKEEMVEFEAPLPKDMRQTLETLRER